MDEHGHDDPGATPRRLRALGRPRTVVLVAYVGALLWRWDSAGVPLERLQVLAWVAGGLVIATTGRPDGGIARVARDWVPIWLVLAAYDLSRGVADTLGMPVQRTSLVHVERFLALGHLPTVEAQERLGPYLGPARWWEVVVTVVYLSHFVVPFAVLGVLWARRREAFRSYRDALLLLTAMGLATYLLLPAAPPWMASRDGLIGPVQRVTLRGMEPLGIDFAASVLRYGTRFGNPVAALPSLHAGWSTLTAVWLARRVRRRWWPLLFAYPAVMGAALVVSGEHYVADVVLGYAFAVVAVLAAPAVARGLTTATARLRRRRVAAGTAAVVDLLPPVPGAGAVIDLTATPAPATLPATVPATMPSVSPGSPAGSGRSARAPRPSPPG